MIVACGSTPRLNRLLRGVESGHGLPERILYARGLRAMTITIQVPGVLRAYSQGAPEISLSVPSVRAALEEIEHSHPSLYKSVCDETGKVRRHVNLFVNTSDIRDPEGLDTALTSGDVLTILHPVSVG